MRTATSATSLPIIQSAPVAFVPGSRFLIANTAYSLRTYAQPDFLYGSGNSANPDITIDNEGIVLFRDGTDAPIDRVGFSDDVPELREGVGLPVITSFPQPVPQYAYVRRTAADGRTQDTDDNAADFILVSTADTPFGSASTFFGAPGPQNLSDPRSGGFTLSNIDVPFTDVPPRTVSKSRAFLGLSRNSSPGKTISVQHSFTNTSDQPLSRLKFRVVEVADMIDIGSKNGAVVLSSRTTTGGGARGATLELPSTRRRGGGINSSLSITSVNSLTPLAVGETITIEFTIAVLKSGSYRIVLLPETAP